VFVDTKVTSIELGPKCEEFNAASLKGLRGVTISKENRLLTAYDSLLVSVKTKRAIRYFGNENSFAIRKEIKVIDDFCFEGCQSLQQIFFEEGTQLQRIGKNAFHNTSLTSIQIPSTVTCIDDQCFYECHHLCEVAFEFPSHLQVIDSALQNQPYGVFAETSIRSIRIPAKVECIKSLAFAHCGSLCEVTLEPRAELKMMEANACFERSLYRRQAKAVSAPVIESAAFSATSLKMFMVLSNVEVIGCLCFEGCKSLSEVIFEPQSRLRIMPESCFQGTCLRKVKIPRSVEVIEGKCFACIHALCEVTFESDSLLRKIGYGAFSRTSLEWICIPASVEYIGSYCFLGCRRLKALEFEPESKLEKIDHGAFSGTKVTEPGVCLPARVIDKADEFFT
jgi:hypothetical protein